MTPAQLSEIRRHLDANTAYYDAGGRMASTKADIDILRQLLAEVDRLTARNAELLQQNIALTTDLERAKTEIEYRRRRSADLAAYNRQLANSDVTI